MPEISVLTGEEEMTQEDGDAGFERSPPKLHKVTDIGKEKATTDEPEVDKIEVLSEENLTSKEEPIAPLLKVEELKDQEPELKKMEQESMVPVVEKCVVSPEVVKEKEKEKDVKESVKEVKKKEPERRGRKPGTKAEKEKAEKEKAEKEMIEKSEPVVNKSEAETSNKDIEKENAESVIEEVKSEAKIEESPFDFKDEEDEKEVPMPVRKKPLALLEKEVNEEVAMETSEKEVAEQTNETKDDSKKELNPRLVLGDEKEAAKSDSEVERRGRKRKAPKSTTPKDIKKMVTDIKATTTVSVVVSSSEKKLANMSPDRKGFVTLAEKKQGFSPMIRKVISPSDKCANDQSAKSDSGAEETASKIELKEEAKKVTELVVVHKASPTKTDIVLGRKIEDVKEDDTLNEKDKDEPEIEQDSVHAVKKKVRKKTKKKLEMEESEMLGLGVVRKRRGPAGRKGQESVGKDVNSKEASNDIDLHCEEEIRSRSASPETLPGSSFIQESQGFVPRVETIDCRISDSQDSDSQNFSANNKQKDNSADKSVNNKNNMFENTPPTTPEHDSDDVSNQQNCQNDQIKMSRSESSGRKTDASQTPGRESPGGNASPSNRSTGSSSGQVAGSEGSIDVPVFSSNKRRRESDEPTPTKRRKRSSKGKGAATRARQLGKFDILK